MNKAQRLVVAAAVAPVLRNEDEQTKSRRVALTDADGNVTGYTTLGEVQRQILARAKIEFDVEGRPAKAICEYCGRVLPVPKAGGPVPKQCRYGCDRECRDCGAEVSVNAARGAAKRREKPLCKSCHGAMQADRLRATPREVRQRAGRESAKRKGVTDAMHAAARTPEARERMRRGIQEWHRSMTPEQRAAHTRKMWDRMTPEQKAERSRKIWETRRANAEKKCAAEQASEDPEKK